MLFIHSQILVKEVTKTDRAQTVTTRKKRKEGEVGGICACVLIFVLVVVSLVVHLRASSWTFSTCSPHTHTPAPTSSSHICSGLGEGCVYSDWTPLAQRHNCPTAIFSVKWRTQQSVILQPQLLIEPDTHSSDTELTELLSIWMKLYISGGGEGPILLATHSSGLRQWWGSECAAIKEGVKEARGLSDLLCFLSKRSWTLSCCQRSAEKNPETPCSQSAGLHSVWHAQVRDSQ